MTAETDSRYAWFRLWISLALATIGGCGMYIVVVSILGGRHEYQLSRVLAERALSRSANFWIFPVAVFGRSEKKKRDGIL